MNADRGALGLDRAGAVAFPVLGVDQGADAAEEDEALERLDTGVGPGIRMAIEDRVLEECGGHCGWKRGIPYEQEAGFGKRRQSAGCQAIRTTARFAEQFCTA